MKQGEHDAVQELLPWHVNETLPAREEELVLKHLSTCEVCQAQRDRLHAMAQLVRDGDAPETDADLSFRRTWQRIEVAERNRASVREIEGPAVSARRWIPFGLAASLMLLIGWQSARQVDEPVPAAAGEYQTLTSGPVVPGDVRRMELGFEQPIPAVTLRQALLETGSSIVSGPDESGVYIVEVRLDQAEDEAAYLEKLQQIEGVRHARFAAH